MGEPPRVFADFNDLLGLGNRVRLNTVGAQRDLDALGVTLSEGLPLLVYDHDENDAGEPLHLVADGQAHWDEDLGCWTALVDPSAMRWESPSN